MGLVIASVMMCACDSEGNYAQDAVSKSKQSVTEFDKRVMHDEVQVREGNIGNIPTPPPEQGGAFQVAERKIIKTANLRMEIRKYAQWNEEVLKKVQNSGGYVVSSSSEKGDENVMRGNMTIRVPQEKFSELLKRNWTMIFFI
ncbi:MAG: DUF4349 domain-containing protein [Bacteroidota bacterium]